MAKTIVDAILGLSFDDSPSNLAAAALFCVLTSDVSDLMQKYNSSKVNSTFVLQIDEKMIILPMKSILYR